MEPDPSRREGDSTPPGGEVLIWDDAIHERFESRQLYFWRLSFAPRYPRKEIFDALDRFYEQAEITSYVVYETLGDFDLLLRVWAPRAYVAEDLELLLRQNLQRCYLWNLNYLACKTELHFSDGEINCERPSAELLETVGNPLINLVNHYNDSQWRRHSRKDLTDEPPPTRPAEIEPLLANGSLRPIPLDTRGIRMFITFDHPRQPFRAETRRRVVKDIKGKCEEIRKRWEEKEEVLESGEVRNIPPPNISIYAGGGSMTDFLVMARAPHGHFHAFVSDLVFGLREIELDELYEMRPYTHVISDRMFSDFKEHRAVAADAGDIAKLVGEEESESLEFKATLATNFRSLVAVNRRERDPEMLDEVVKAVCGLLNSPRGGTLVIGVLEVKRELEKVKDPERYLKVLEEEFDYSPAVDEEGQRSFPNAVVGVEVDLDPGLFPDLDRYVGHLRDSLKTRISPIPWPWLTIEVKEVRGKKVCLVWVRPGDVWFYAKTGDSQVVEFFVREGASTPAYPGAESDLYKRAHPRELPGPNGYPEANE
jgi:hypothetical protein